MGRHGDRPAKLGWRDMGGKMAGRGKPQRTQRAQRPVRPAFEKGDEGGGKRKEGKRQAGRGASAWVASSAPDAPSQAFRQRGKMPHPPKEGALFGGCGFQPRWGRMTSARSTEAQNKGVEKWRRTGRRAVALYLLRKGHVFFPPATSLQNADASVGKRGAKSDLRGWGGIGQDKDVV